MKNMIRAVSMLFLLMLQAKPAFASAQLGVYEGGGCNGVSALAGFDQWLGHQPDRALDFFADDSWANMVGSAAWSSGCWAKAGMVNMTFSVPMLVADKISTLAQGAQGAYDGYFTQVARTLVQNHYGSATLRLGWEFNGGWTPWAASKDPADWISYWRHIVTAMRAVPGANFTFDWCPALGAVQIPQPQVYPGDDVVDIIGTDIYNQTWNPLLNTPQLRWQSLVTMPYGLNWQQQFAASKNKPMSYPEWGTGTRPDGHGGGDDPYFVDQMGAWIASHAVAYHDYWDYAAADYNAKLSNGQSPNAGAEFLRLFR